jgi:uncharacterized OB-fold protein
MSDATAPPLAIAICQQCHSRFLPHPGPCPRCGSADLVVGEIPASAVVLAATELLAPAAGWSSPHGLAIAEGSESVRILAIVRGPRPHPGAVVTVRTEGGLYFAQAEAKTLRGEEKYPTGPSPKTRATP